MATPVARPDGRRWGSNYPPLLLAGLILLALLAVLPSALDLPQSSPSETLEYAPVPPEDQALDDPPPGNISSLGLAGSGSLGTGEGEGGPGLGGEAAGTTGVGKNPSTKKCVGNPPRQTEDPLSPPCVAHFSGDNFGATYQGLTGDEVRVLFYFRGGAYGGTAGGSSQHPPNTYYDLGRPPAGDEPAFVNLLRAYQRYFNERYQTYGRFVRVYVRFDNGDLESSPETRSADAAQDFKEVKPFAVVSEVPSHAQVYVSEMARRGVVVFLGNPSGGAAGSASQTESAYVRLRPLLWSYIPSVEQRSRMFTTYVCTKLLPYPVSFSANAGENGTARRLGLLKVTDPTKPELIAFGVAVERGIEACGGRWVARGELPFDNRGNTTESGTNNMARFRQAGVTTVVQAGGADTTAGNTRGAAAIGYRPEWMLAGDGMSDANIVGLLQEQSVWAQARAVSLYPLVSSIERQPCFQAAREGDATLERVDVKNWACIFYPDLRMLFTGVQVAGPRLTPANLDRGFHAIPSIQSGDPQVPACFFERDDFTCVKDAVQEWWDPSGRDPGHDSPGCWRVMEGGRRHLSGRWPGGDVESARSSSDPCNSQGFSVS